MEVPFEQTTSVCRGCLATGRGMLHAKRFEAEFEDVTGIHISPADGLPQLLCYECSALLQKCARFRNKVIKSHNLLCQYVHESIPFPCEESASPHLSRTRIMYYEFPGAQAEQIEEQTDGEMKINSVVENSGTPIISKVAKAGIKMEYVWRYDEDDIKLEENDAYVRERTELATQGRNVKDTTTSDVHESEQVFVKCEQTRCSSDIEEQTNGERKINSVVDEGSALVFSEIESPDIKIESVWSYDKDNLDECDIQERTELATQRMDLKDFTTREDYESKQVALKFYNCERIAHYDQTEDGSSVISPPSDVCDEHLKRTLNSVNSSSPNNVQLYICDTCNKCFKTKVEIIKHIHVHSGYMPSKGDISMKHLSSTKHNRMHTGDKYKCGVCMKCFITKGRLNRHNSIHTGEKPFKCDVCMKCFSTKSVLIEHNKIHTGEKPFKCDVCIKCFTYKSDLTVHSRIHTGEKLYKCDVCMKCFARSSDLNKHSRIHTGVKPFKCDVCMKCFAIKSDLTKHNRIHTCEKPYKCDVCMKRFSRRASLIDHSRTHTGERPFKCDVCMKCFKRQSNLNTHKKIHTGFKPYKCDVCMKCFISKGALIKHNSIHTGKRPYKCDVCLKCFNRKAHLIEHSRAHTGVKPFKCDVCMKCFNRKANLIEHSRTHTGVTPFKCDVCIKYFITKGRLTRHDRIHTGEKPFKCDVCMKCFIAKAHLTIHNRVHTGEKPFKCEVCMKCFTNGSNLTKHNRIHTLENTFKCDVCMKCFTNKSHLIKHIRLHTGQNSF